MHSFVVRVWRDRDVRSSVDRWRGYIQDAEGRRHLFFLGFDEMVRFIVDVTGARPTSGGALERFRRWLRRNRARLLGGS